MNIPFEFSANPGAGTPSHQRVLNTTDNLILADIITDAPGGGSTSAAKLQNCGLGGVLTLADFFLAGFSITTDVDAKVEIGLYKVTGTVFTAFYTCLATKAVAGGIVRELDSGPLLPNNATEDNANFRLALRITPAAAGAFRVGGDIHVRARQPLPV